jgi:hypothetical protein
MVSRCSTVSFVTVGLKNGLYGLLRAYFDQVNFLTPSVKRLGSGRYGSPRVVAFTINLTATLVISMFWDIISAHNVNNIAKSRANYTILS